MIQKRKRKCMDCGKPLGSTVGRCFECGGESPSPSRDERLQPAVWWKIELGVPYKQIQKAHEHGDGRFRD